MGIKTQAQQQKPWGLLVILFRCVTMRTHLERYDHGSVQQLGLEFRPPYREELQHTMKFCSNFFWSLN